jgi:AcrR family transcriptional regulator
MAQAKRAAATGRRGTLNEDRWRQVLRSAEEVFEENGYPSASLQDIASRVGMLKGSLYYYIDSKEDLLFEVMQNAHRMGLELAGESPEMQGRDAAQRLAAFIRRWMDGVERGWPDIDIAEEDIRFLSPEHREAILEIRRRINGCALEIITAGIREGLFDGGVDPRMATSSLFQLLNGHIWRGPAPAASLTDLIEWYARIVLRALATSDSLPGVLTFETTLSSVTE